MEGSMDYVVNDEMMSTKHILINSINSNIKNVENYSKQIEYLLTRIFLLIGESPSGTDIKMGGNCHRSIDNLYNSLASLRQGLDNALQLNCVEEKTYEDE
jgi:hypothetical protein